LGINETISITKDLGVKMVMTKRTEQEWLWGIEKANEEYKTIHATRPSLLPSLKNAFIKSFFKRQLNETSLTWDNYYFQLRQIRAFIREKGIDYWYKKEFDPTRLPNKEFLEPLGGRVYGCARLQGNPKSKEVCEHDAYHLLLVRKLREEVGPDALGPSFWFFTLDSTLNCADEGLNELIHLPLEPPSSFMANLWISHITPFLGARVPERRLAEAFAHLMSTPFASIQTGLSAEMVIETLSPWLPFSKLTDKDIEAIIGDALVTQYYEELKEARATDPRRIEELAEKLRNRVDERVFQVFDELVAEAQIGREKAEKERIEKENQLTAETQRKKLILNFCLVFGIAFIIPGFVFLILGNVFNGAPLIISGVVFIVLSLGFRTLKFKTGPFELEAHQ
jgi:hypothetical protein